MVPVGLLMGYQLRDHLHNTVFN